jgi:drug/metabolite transporter (DMT)-like permease
MEIGLIFALIAAVGFAGGIVVIRKATALAGESFTVTVFSVFLGIPFFAVALFISGEWDILWSVSGRVLMLLGAAGVIHFVVGRTLGYNAYRIIGANKGTPFTMIAIFYTVIFGVLFLHEPLTIFLALGVVCIFIGAVLITTEGRSVSKGRERGFLRTEFSGILNAMGAAICWGISPILIKLALTEIGSPLVGAFISYATASIVLALLYFRRQHREQLARLPFVPTLLTMVIGGIVASTGQLFNYLALGHIAASVAAPNCSTQILLVLLFSFLLNRQIEVFTLRVISGMLAIVIGTFLIFY